MNDALLPVWMSTNAGRDLFLYVTHDGGTTWSTSSGFAWQSFNTDIVSMQDAITWDWAGVFHVTNDAGTTSRQVTPNVNLGDSLRTLDFISTSTGWVVDVDAYGNIALYRTIDGGITWNALFGNTAPPQVATNTPTPTPTVAHTVPHPLGQLPGQEYVSFARQAGGVHMGAKVSVGTMINVGVSVTGGTGVNRVHANRAKSTQIADNRFIILPFCSSGLWSHAEGESR